VPHVTLRKTTFALQKLAVAEAGIRAVMYTGVRSRFLTSSHATCGMPFGRSAPTPSYCSISTHTTSRGYFPSPDWSARQTTTTRWYDVY